METCNPGVIWAGVVTGNPVTKKNSARIAKTKTGRPFILPSERYVKYEKLFLKQVASLPEPIRSGVNVKCVYYMDNRRRVDLLNLLEATCDALVKAGVLEDDKSGIVVGHDGSRVKYDRENPRVEITISQCVEDGGNPAAGDT